MTQLITSNFKKYIGTQLIEAVTEPANTEFYFFLGEHVERTTNTIPTPVDSVRETVIDTYRDMICGKRLQANDFSLMVRNVPYESKAFAMYDDNDDTLISKDYFCTVNAGAYYHTYKCLDNNMGANSTVEPDFSHVTGANTQVYQTSDGYRWKYMYSTSSADYTKFATPEFIPVTANATVVSQATPGRIDIVKIDAAGKNYGNYTNGTFGTTGVRVDGDPLIYEISNASSVSTTAGFYTGAIMYLTSGTGSGQYRQITDYFANDSGNFVQVNSAFTTPPVNGTTFDINPYVQITGDGQELDTAEGRALINALSTNSVYRVELFNNGNAYNYATATVVANATVGVTNEAELRPIYGPLGGHGADAAAELGCEYFGMSISFANNESDTIVETNSFQKFGILRDPLFANVQLDHSVAADGLFAVSEPFHKISPIQITTAATINTSSNAISANTGKFSNQVAAGDVLYLEASNGTSQQLAYISGVTNATHMTMTVNGYFACTDVTVHIANTSAQGYVNVVTNATSMLVTNVSGTLVATDTIVGNTSGAKLTITTIKRNNETKGFETFMQLYKYIGTITSGTFQEDEIIYQSNINTSNGFLHSTDTDGTTTFYVSNQVGDFTLAGGLVGNTSTATATLAEKYEPELVFGSGDVLFLENANSTPRANTQTFKTIFNL